MGDRIALAQGDIMKQAVGAIVNAANSSLLAGGGVDRHQPSPLVRAHTQCKA